MRANQLQNRGTRLDGTKFILIALAVIGHLNALGMKLIANSFAEFILDYYSD
jgi:fucose 4-O-acetylase-like acetyltransferase